jgi:hypothetical protein
VYHASSQVIAGRGSRDLGDSSHSHRVVVATRQQGRGGIAPRANSRVRVAGPTPIAVGRFIRNSSLIEYLGVVRDASPEWLGAPVMQANDPIGLSHDNS